LVEQSPFTGYRGFNLKHSETMTKLEKIIYDAIQSAEQKPVPWAWTDDREAQAKSVASAVLPLIEKAFEAGIIFLAYQTPLRKEDTPKPLNQREWLSENITGEVKQELRHRYET
jgi:hypothetical protein